MTKKALFLSSIPMMALPTFAIVSCAGASEMQGQTELARSGFLIFKQKVSFIAASKPKTVNEFETAINNTITATSDPLISKKEVNVRAEGNNFVVDYRLFVWSGSFDQAINDKSEIKKNGTEELRGTLRFPILS